jgi:Ca2+-binding RTX toxin-like protein
VLVEEREAAGAATNNSFETAQHLSGIGTGPGGHAAVNIAGTLGAPFRIVIAEEDDGAISLANTTGLIAGGTDTILVNATIGDGPHSSHGTGGADYDHYLVPTRAGQLITVEVEAYDLGSTLDSVVGIYDSAGQLLASNNDKSNDYYNGYGHLNLDSRLRFLAPADDTYSVVVLGAGSGFQADPHEASSGGRAASEGPYQLMIALESPFVANSVVEDGAIPFATPTGLVGGAPGKAFASGTVGDGLHGASGTGTGDFDFFRVDALPGQLIEVDVNTQNPAAEVDLIVAIFTSAGEWWDYQDDDGLTFDPRLVHPVSFADTYYIAVGGNNGLLFNSPGDPFDPASGSGAGSEGAYSLTIEVRPNDVDFYSLDLEAGDIVGVNLGGFGAQRTALINPALNNPVAGTVLISSEIDGSANSPDESSLPGGADASFAYVINTPGRHVLSVSRGVGPYQAELRVFRPILEQQPAFTRQVLFLDFDGATLDTSIFERSGRPNSTLSPLSAFLPRWGLGAADEDAVIDAIIATVAENFAQDVSGVLGRGLNGDFLITGQAGDFQIEILNSRDHADPFGFYPNVSRVIVGGTIEEAFGPEGEFLIGVAETIDVGNFDMSETALALLDALSEPEGLYSLNHLPRGPGVSMIELIGPAIGNVVSHEAGHFFGNWHTFTPDGRDIMGPAPFLFAGADGLYGTDDDLDVDFGEDPYLFFEGYAGVEDTLNTIAFGLSTGTRPGTYFDFVTGTLYVSGTIDDGRRDHLKIMTDGAEVKVFINGELVDRRPAADVQRVHLNGSNDEDWLDASGFVGPSTINGKDGHDLLSGGNFGDLLDAGGGNDFLHGGDGNDLLLGGRGNDALFAGPGNDILLGGDGHDILYGDDGRDLLIGGLGADLLFGGNGEDILIGGATTHDSFPDALRKIHDEWASDRGFDVRVANIRDGSGSLDRVNDSAFLQTLSTVPDDGATDVLFGGDGRDWFFQPLGRRRDLIGDGRHNEPIG